MNSIRETLLLSINLVSDHLTRQKSGVQKQIYSDALLLAKKTLSLFSVIKIARQSKSDADGIPLKFRTYLKMAKEMFEHIDMGKCFSLKDDRDNEVQPKAKEKSHGYCRQSLDEFFINRKKRFKSLYPNDVLDLKGIRELLDWVEHCVNFLYQDLTNLLKEKKLMHRDIDEIVFPRHIRANFPTITIDWQDQQWRKMYDCLLLPPNDPTLKQIVLYLLRPPPLRVVQLNFRPPSGVKEAPPPALRLPPLQHKRRRILEDSSDDEIESVKQFTALEHEAEKIAETETTAQVDLIKNLRSSSPQNNKSVNMGISSYQTKSLLTSLRQVGGKRYRACKIRILKTSADLGQTYPQWMCGVSKCHFRALYSISPELAIEARDLKLSYKDSDAIKKLVEEHGKEDCFVFQVADTDHWVALTRTHYIDDHFALLIENFGLAYIMLMYQEGYKPGEGSFEVPLSYIMVPLVRNVDYQISPARSTLMLSSEEDLKAIRQFKVTRKGVGSIEWINPVDVRFADIDKTVIIDRLRVSVEYPEGEKPNVGEKLNGPAIISFFNITPHNDISVQRYVKGLGKAIRRAGMTFISYDADTKTLIVSVQHFSGYEVDVTEEDLYGSQQTLDSQNESRQPAESSLDETDLETSQHAQKTVETRGETVSETRQADETSQPAKSSSDETELETSQPAQKTVDTRGETGSETRQADSNEQAWKQAVNLIRPFEKYFRSKNDNYLDFQILRDNEFKQVGSTPPQVRRFFETGFYWTSDTMSALLTAIERRLRSPQDVYIHLESMSINNKVEDRVATAKKVKEWHEENGSAIDQDVLDSLKVYREDLLNFDVPENKRTAPNLWFLCHQFNDGAQHFAVLDVKTNQNPTRDEFKHHITMIQVYGSLTKTTAKKICELFVKKFYPDAPDYQHYCMNTATQLQRFKHRKDQSWLYEYVKKKHGPYDDGCSCGPESGSIILNLGVERNLLTVEPEYLDPRVRTKNRMGRFLMHSLKLYSEENSFLQHPQFSRSHIVSDSGIEFAPPKYDQFSYQKYLSRLFDPNSRHVDDRFCKGHECCCENELFSGESFITHWTCMKTYHCSCVFQYWRKLKPRSTMICYHCEKEVTEEAPLVLVPCPEVLQTSSFHLKQPIGIIFLDFVSSPPDEASLAKYQVLAREAKSTFQFLQELDDELSPYRVRQFQLRVGDEISWTSSQGLQLTHQDKIIQIKKTVNDGKVDWSLLTSGGFTIETFSIQGTSIRFLKAANEDGFNPPPGQVIEDLFENSDESVELIEGKVALSSDDRRKSIENNFDSLPENAKNEALMKAALATAMSKDEHDRISRNESAMNQNEVVGGGGGGDDGLSNPQNPHDNRNEDGHDESVVNSRNETPISPHAQGDDGLPPSNEDAHGLPPPNEDAHDESVMKKNDVVRGDCNKPSTEGDHDLPDSKNPVDNLNEDGQEESPVTPQNEIPISPVGGDGDNPDTQGNLNEDGQEESAATPQNEIPISPVDGDGDNPDTHGIESLTGQKKRGSSKSSRQGESAQKRARVNSTAQILVGQKFHIFEIPKNSTYLATVDSISSGDKPYNLSWTRHDGSKTNDSFSAAQLIEIEDENLQRGFNGGYFLPHKSMSVTVVNLSGERPTRSRGTINEVDIHRGIAWVKFEGYAEPDPDPLPCYRMIPNELECISRSRRVYNQKEWDEEKIGYLEQTIVPFQGQQVMVQFPGAVWQGTIVAIEGYFVKVNYKQGKNRTDWFPFGMISAVEGAELKRQPRSSKRRKINRFDPCQDTTQLQDAAESYLAALYKKYPTHRPKKQKLTDTELYEPNFHKFQSERLEHLMQKRSKIFRLVGFESNIITTTNKDLSEFKSYIDFVGRLRNWMLETDCAAIFYTPLSSFIFCDPDMDLELSCFSQLSTVVIILINVTGCPLLEKFSSHSVGQDSKHNRVVILAHGPPDISQELIKDTLENPSLFEERFSLVWVSSDVTNMAKKNKNLSEFGGFSGCGNYDYLMKDIVRKFDDNKDFLPLTFPTTTKSLIQEFVKGRASSFETYEYSMPAKETLKAIFCNQGNVSKVEDKICLSMRGLFDSINHYASIITKDQIHQNSCASLECSVVKNFNIFRVEDGKFIIQCQECNQNCCQKQYASLRDAVLASVTVGPLHAVSSRFKNEKEQDIQAYDIYTDFLLSYDDTTSSPIGINVCSSTHTVNSCLGLDSYLLNAIKRSKSDYYDAEQTGGESWYKWTIDTLLRGHQSQPFLDEIERVLSGRSGLSSWEPALISGPAIRVKSSEESDGYRPADDNLTSTLIESSESIFWLNPRDSSFPSQIPDDWSGITSDARVILNTKLRQDNQKLHDIIPPQCILENESTVSQRYAAIPKIALRYMNGRDESIHVVTSIVSFVGKTNDERDTFVSEVNGECWAKVIKQESNHICVEWVMDNEFVAITMDAMKRNVLRQSHLQQKKITNGMKRAMQNVFNGNIIHFEPWTLNLINIDPYLSVVYGRNRSSNQLLQFSSTQYILASMDVDHSYRYHRQLEKMSNPCFSNGRLTVMKNKHVFYPCQLENAKDRSLQNPLQAMQQATVQHATATGTNGCSLDKDSKPKCSSTLRQFSTKVSSQDWNCLRGNTSNTLEIMNHLNYVRSHAKYMEFAQCDDMKKLSLFLSTLGYNVQNLPSHMNYEMLSKVVTVANLPMIVSLRLPFNTQTTYYHVIGIVPHKHVSTSGDTIVSHHIIDGAVEEMLPLPFNRENLDWCCGSGLKFTTADSIIAFHPSKKISRSVAGRLTTEEQDSLEPSVVCLEKDKRFLISNKLAQLNVIERSTQEITDLLKSLIKAVKNNTNN